MHHRYKAASAALVAILALASCSSAPAEPEGPSMDELADACLDIFSSYDDPAGYCADALDVIADDPTSEQAQTIYDVLVDHIENP